MAEEANGWAHHHAKLGPIHLHYVEAGPPDGRLVVLLHGFPEFWYSWRHQIKALAAHGLRVVAPDLRGYNLSSRPRGVRHYRMRLLERDVQLLIKHLGCSSAVIVGHDWGGVIAWCLTMHHPALVEKLIILNAPHPALIPREMRRLGQLRRSWYQFFFQLPWLPEAALRARNYQMLRDVLRRDPVNRRTFTRRDIEKYVHAARESGALTGAINYYRAAWRGSLRHTLGRWRVINCPVLVIWGSADRYLNPGFLDGPQKWAPDLQVERLACGHWVQNEMPQEVNDLMRAFLAPQVQPAFPSF